MLLQKTCKQLQDLPAGDSMEDAPNMKDALSLVLNFWQINHTFNSQLAEPSGFARAASFARRTPEFLE